MVRRRANATRFPLFGWLWRLLLGTALLSCGVVLALRFVDPPFTAFMAQAWLVDRTVPLTLRWVDDACLPDSARLAVMAAEDQKFPDHWGFDLVQIEGAIDDARRGRRLRGASTLTQQTAKNLFLWPGQSWLRKGLEAGLAVVIEAIWNKRRILEVYLNVAEFAPGIYGMHAAARHFFGVPPVGLSDDQSALLAAVLPSPRRFDAAAPSDYLQDRRQWILRQMRQLAGMPGVERLLDRDRASDRDACGTLG